MESHRLLEDLLSQSRRQTRLLEEIRDLLAALRGADKDPRHPAPQNGHASFTDR